MTRRAFLSLSTGASLVPFLGTRAASEAPLRLDLSPREPECVAVDFEALLWAIAERETHNRDDVAGPRGELGRYQLTMAVLRQHLFDSDPINKVSYERAARKHLAWLDANVPRGTITERYEREYALSWAWRGGLTGWLDYSSPTRGWRTNWKAAGGYERVMRISEYAAQVGNLYRDRLRTLSTPTTPTTPCTPSPHYRLSSTPEA